MRCIELHDINPFVRHIEKSYGLVHKFTMYPYEHRMIYFLEGNGIIELQHKKYETKKYDLILLSPGTPYHIISDSDQIGLVIYFDLTQENSQLTTRIFPTGSKWFDPKKILCDYKLLNNSEPVDMLFLPGVIRIFDKMKELHTLFKERRYFHDSIISGEFKACVATALEQACFKDKLTDRKTEIAKMVIDYIKLHYAEDIKNEDIAKYFRYHPSYINRIMIDYTEMPIHQFLIKYRLNKAMKLLSQPEYSISEVAEMVGFCNTKHFSSCFKNEYGISPSKARGII